MIRLPDGCSVKWTKYPARQDRLLDWLESHPLERHRLFNAKSGRQLSMTTCANRAAQAIFAQDENPANRAAVKNDSEPFGSAILSLIRKVWRPKYQKVIKAIGRDAARMPYADFDSNSNAKKVAKLEMIKFPQWVRLHNFWRLLPEFNQFAVRGESPSRAAGRKRKTRHVEDSDDSESEDSNTSSSAQKPVEKADVKIGPPGRGLKRIKRSPTKPTHSRLVKTENHAPILIDLEDDSPTGCLSSASTLTTGSLSKDRQFEKEMAELRLRTQEQEFKAKEQELKALSMQKKHEALMAYLQSTEI